MQRIEKAIGVRGVYLLILITIFAVIGQYFFLHIEHLLSGEVRFFKLRERDFGSVGFWRYIKDAGYLVVAIASSWLLWISNSSARRRWILFLYVEAAFLLLGTMGHIAYPSTLYWVAGMRWILTLHCIVSLGMLIFLTEQARGGQLKKSVDRAIAFALLMITVVIILQALVNETPLLSGRYRLYSLAPNAGALGYWLVGIGVYFFMGRFAWQAKILSLSTVLFVVNLSGSRGPEIVILTLISFELLSYFFRGQSDLVKKRLFVVWCLSLLIQLPIFSQLASYSANRGGLLVTQGMPSVLSSIESLEDIEGARQLGSEMDSSSSEGVGCGTDGEMRQAYAKTRLENMKIFVEVMATQPLSATIFGRGLGYGTNTAYLMQPIKHKCSHTWVEPIDSAHAAYIAQFGLLGYAAMGFIVFSLIKSVIKRLSSIEDKARFYVFVGGIFLLTLVQNVLENQLLVALCGVSIAFFIRERFGKNAVAEERLAVSN